MAKKGLGIGTFVLRVCGAIGFVFLIFATPLSAQNVDLLQAQIFLTGEGYNPGPADGLYGNRTMKALLAFQKAHGLDATGQLDGATKRLIQEVLTNTIRSNVGVARNGETSSPDKNVEVRSLEPLETGIGQMPRAKPVLD